MADVFANNRSILHKGDGLQHVAAPPDTCKTPTPGGPAPLPYPNMAMSSALAKGTKKVKIDGQSVATEAANLSTSTGDEPGTAGGGVISNKFKGKMTWGTSSTDVKFEGKGVARFSDVTQHNNNTYNTAFIALGEGNTGVAYADDFDGTCEICEKGPSEHRIFETRDSVEFCKQIIAKLQELSKKYRNPLSGESLDFDKLIQYGGERELSKDEKSTLARHRENSNLVRDSFMVGVAICTCKTVYTAKSGAPSQDAFERIALEVSGVHKAVKTQKVGEKKFIESNNFTGKPKVDIPSFIGQRWKAMQTRKDNGDKEYSHSGTCAAI
ncbi:MAG TPA: DUF4150 domain-containing protein, partial [Polyangium sp.]|nr:DUF4150 domain-containing protein [Polyangium sp.]